MPPKKPSHRRHLCPLALYRVAGDSMRPTYAPGDTLLGWRWIRTPHPGRVVVARDPTGRPLIKRLTARDLATGALTLLGDNPAASTDSRQLGPFPADSLEAIIVAKLP